MEKNISRRDFIKLAGYVAGSLAVSTCAPKLTTEIPMSTSTEIPTSTIVPTVTVPDNVIAQTQEIPEWKKPLEERFAFGDLKIGAMNFSLVMPVDLLSTMNFTDDKDRVYDTKNPIEVITDYLPYDNDGQPGQEVADTEGRGAGQEFFKSAKKDGGKTPMIFLTDKPNILMLDAHSESIKAPGEVARIIGSFWEKNQKKDDEVIGRNMMVLGKNIIFRTEDGQDINTKISFVKTVTKEQFEDDTSEKRFWSLMPTRDNIVYFTTDTAGIPDEIRNDQTPGVYYLIIIACMPQNGDPINLNIFDKNRYAFNTAERAIVVLKFDLRK